GVFFPDHHPQAIREIRKLLRSCPVADLFCGKAVQVTEAIHNRRENGGPGRSHKFRLHMLLIDRRMSEQICGCWGRNRKDTDVAVNKPAAYVDGRTQKAFNPQRLETNCRSNRIDDRIDSSNLMKLDVFR